MLGAILTTVFFALSAITGQKVAVRLGSQWGNFVRLVLAGAVLWTVTLAWFRDSLNPHTFAWFFVSGLIGFGIGDVALFAAYTRIGSRLTILLNLCLAPVFAILMEAAWLGHFPAPSSLCCIAAILGGVVLVILKGSPSQGAVFHHERNGSFAGGVVAAVTAGFGQGAGTVVSRKAESIATVLGVEVNGVSAAGQRVLAGVVVALAVVAFFRFYSKQLPVPSLARHVAVSGWLFGAALFGPVIGVSCFQWALQSLESGVVLGVVALTPILTIPLAAITEKDRPGPWAIFGALMAVAGVAALYLLISGG